MPKLSYASKKVASRTNTTSKGKNLVNKGGRVLKAPKVKVIFWGTNPLDKQIDQQLRSLIASNYYNVVTQYGAGKPVYMGSVHAPIPPPATVTDAALTNLIGKMITSGTVPDLRNNDVVYVVIPGPGVKNADKTGDAYNTSFSWGHTNGVLCTYYGKQDMASITRALSEEIAEAITSPGPQDAWTAGPDNFIGDPCSTPFVVAGVTVEGLWSNAKGACTTAAG
jgi:hypothetical protein